MNLYQELSLVLRVFAENDLDYAVCGGIAVAFHGYERFTKDIDILIREEDLDHVHELLEQVGFMAPSGRIPFEHHELFRIMKVDGSDYMSLDLLVVNDKLEGVWEGRRFFDWQGKKIVVVSREGLAKMKRLAGRDQDLLDLKKLGLDDD
jgi:Uncharacterised nucleotidyltransferase